MALSLLVNIDSSPDVHQIGTLKLTDDDSNAQKNSTSEIKSSGKEDIPAEQQTREIRLTFTGCDDVYSEILSKYQSNLGLNITELKVLPHEIASKTERGWIKNGGKLSYDIKWVRERGNAKTEPRTVLNAHSNSTSSNRRLIFKGYYEYDIAVAIERMQIHKATMTEIKREFRILKELDLHENFIRYYTFEVDEKEYFVYIATELCLCSIADLFEPVPEKSVPWEEILSALPTKAILFQATRGLNYLHENGFVHRNIKPSSFLVKDVRTKKGSAGYLVKITDFRLSRPLEVDAELSGTTASGGWVAPESRWEKYPLRQSLDVFILGCFYYYVLTGASKDSPACHPFGRNEMERLSNISAQTKCEVYKEKWQCKYVDDQKAVALIKKMIRFEEKDRASLSNVLADDYFKISNRDYYPIYDYKIPGLCCIFNQEYFTALPFRAGSSVDRKKLEDTFKELGFEVIAFKNLMSFDLKNMVKKLAAKDYSNYGSLVICIMSHGIENAIAASDCRYVNLNKLKYKFSYGKCPSLYGKPKIFIVQSCQGTLEQNYTDVVPVGSGSSDNYVTGSEESTVHLSASSAAIKRVRNYFDWRNGPPEGNPPLLDFLTITSTLPGFVSLRNSQTGTYFIQALCDKLQQVYIKESEDFSIAKENLPDLEEILRGENGVQATLNRNLKKASFKQTLSWEACLSKHIRFQRNQKCSNSEETYDSMDGGSEQDFKENYFFVPCNTSNSNAEETNVLSCTSTAEDE